MPSVNFRTGANVPVVRDFEADVSIPSSAWSRWIPADGPRQLRRALTPAERATLERRRDGLAHAVAPYQRGVDVDRVALALSDMFGSFSSMRQSGEEAMARVDGATRSLEQFPAWAIEKACADVQINGVWREGRFDRRWPPSDAEVAEVVRGKLRLYGDTHASAVQLLAAKVEER